MHWSALPVWKRDLAIALLVTCVAELEIILLTAPSGMPLDWLLVNLLILPALALRRVRPLLAALVAASWFVVQLLPGEQLPVAVPFLAILFVVASIGWYSRLWPGLVGTGAVLIGGLASALVRGTNAGDIAVNAVIIVGAWAVGHLLRRSSDHRVLAEVTADRARHEAVAAERGRIARDLHDSMGHALTLITLQAGSGRERATEPGTRDLLSGIESTGREALADMHRLLRLVGSGDEGLSGVAALPDLIADSRRRDLDVELAVDLPQDVPATLSTTVYRIVQEGLTNIIRHSDAVRAHVGVTRDADGTVVVRVADDGRARPARIAGTGRGIAGLRERVDLLGGAVTSGQAESGWTLEARIPWPTS